MNTIQRRQNSKPCRALSDCEDLFEQKIVSNVEGNGWFVAHCPKTDLPLRPDHLSEVPECDIAYTIGLWESFLHPEVVVLGLPPEKSQALLTYVANSISERRRFDKQASFEGVLEDYRCRLEFIKPEKHRAYLPYARWFYRGDGFKAMQLCWPDSQGHYPSDPAFEQRLRPLQPYLVD